MKLTRRSKWTIAVLAALVILPLANAILLLPEPHLVGHRALNAGFEEWMLENHTKVYPNIDGNSVKSISVIEPYFSKLTNDLRDYAYIPGLRPDDPNDLVMIYVKEKSRRSWHGDFATVFGEQRWVVITPSFWPLNPNGKGELNDWSDTQQFKTRLKKTIEFLKENNRPNWQNVVEEQTKFLNSIQD